MIREMTLGNGLRVAVESLEAPQTASLAWLVPAGSAGDPVGDAGEGTSAVLAEMLLRGAGSRDSRAHSDALDALGVDRRTSASVHHLVLSATMLGSLLPEALPLLAEMIIAPRLDAAHLEPAKRLAIQAIDGLEDEPQHLVMTRLVERFFPPPFNRSGLGDRQGIAGLTIEALREAWRRRVVPGGSILAIAGAVDPDATVKQLESLTAGWRGAAVEPAASGPASGGTLHVPSPSAQTHLALALWAPTERAPEALRHRMAVRILGGETSSRLFTEVRERRGLCYSVGASASLGRDRGSTTIYAGSTPDRAGTTLAQIRAEIRRLGEGVARHEFDRAAIGYRSRLVMQGESTASRASAMAIDLHRLGRARSLEECTREVLDLDFESLDRYARGPLAERWSEAPTMVVVGPRPLDGG